MDSRLSKHEIHGPGFDNMVSINSKKQRCVDQFLRKTDRTAKSFESRVGPGSQKIENLGPFRFD